MNRILSVCIPTYNRATFLQRNLIKLVTMCEPLAIPIYISDNCSTDNTEKVIESIKKRYTYIFYKKLEKNMGIDYNMNSVISMSKTQFSWLFSDDDEIYENSFEFIVESIKQTTPDFILVNHFLRDLKTKVLIKEEELVNGESLKIITPKILLEKYASKMTLLSACIVKTNLWRQYSFESYQSKYYFHISNIFNALQKNSRVLLIGKALFTRYAGNDWSFNKNEISLVVPYYYPKTIDLLPRRYSLLSKYKGIRCKKNARIGIRRLLLLRRQNLTGLKSFPLSYYPLLGILFPFFVIILMMPIYFSKLLYALLLR